MELMGGKKGGTELLGMDVIFGRENGWNGTLMRTEEDRGKVL